jgi:hypothetical protein
LYDIVDSTYRMSIGRRYIGMAQEGRGDEYHSSHHTSSDVP